VQRDFQHHGAGLRSTEETTASTREIAAGATKTATSAEKLRELVGQFRLPDASRD
jgi:hypothetical protein